MTTAHWADVLTLRPEVISRRGHAEGLQMSLFDAVYRENDVPYRDAGYWCDITEPTVRLTEFFAQIALCVSDAHIDGKMIADRLFHLDQGMGGGKSHALCGLWHMATNSDEFFDSDVGSRVAQVAAQRSGQHVDLSDVRVVVLCADHFSPGVARPEFGPATTLHERFLWALFGGDVSLYEHHVGRGADKAAIKDALEAADRPVIVLLDEIMDYALALAQPDQSAFLPGEQGFLNALTEVVTTTARAAMVIVMIRSDLDEQGYDGPAAEFRGYLSSRLERNGTTVSVNEPQDFGAIIRRRIFTTAHGDLPVDGLTDDWSTNASSAWREQVFDRLPGARQLGGFAARLKRSYPFHPDLLDLVEHDWTKYAGFQRVRSTVEIFAATAFWWVTEHKADRWAPELMGVGDIPLHTAKDEVLASGVLHGSESQRVGLRQIAEKDITSTNQQDGQAVLVDQRITDGRTWASVQPHPAVRLATALWMYSVVARAQGTQGATRPELLAAIYIPDLAFGYTDAEETFNALTDDEDERGLGALDVIKGSGGNQLHRYLLATDMNKRVFHRNALNRVTSDMSYDLVWERAIALASTGPSFNRLLPIPLPDENAKLEDVFRDVDQQRSNRLVVLHPKRWTLLNGRDSTTRADIEALLGLGKNALGVGWSATCVVACVNTQRRDALVKKARNAVGWRLAVAECSPDLPLLAEMKLEAANAMSQVDAEVRRAYQHYAFVVREDASLRLEVVRLEDDRKTALSGSDVWDDLAEKGEAVKVGAGLAGSYLHKLVNLQDRAYTLKEVVEKFWRDPAFPMVAGEREVRAAIFDALNRDEDGVAWELVDSKGASLQVTAPDQLAISSIEQQLRFSVPTALRLDGDDGPDESTSARVGALPPDGPEGRAIGHAAGSADRSGEPSASTDSTSYSVFEMSLGNTSLTDLDLRERLYRFLTEVAATIDSTSGIDVQIASIAIKLTAPAGSLDELKEPAALAEASFAEVPEDF